MQSMNQGQVGGDHYERCSIQPWEIIQRNGLDYWEGTVLKYLLRHKRKNGKEDLMKLQHFLSYQLEHYEELYVQSNTQKRVIQGSQEGNVFPQLHSSESFPSDLSSFFNGGVRTLNPSASKCG